MLIIGELTSNITQLWIQHGLSLFHRMITDLLRLIKKFYRDLLGYSTVLATA